MKKETKSIRIQAKRSQHREHSSSIYMTSGFVFDSAEQVRQLFAEEIQGNVYSRFSNPNTTELIDKMAALENTQDGFAFASGMAAVFAGMVAFLSSGDHIVASRALFGSSFQILTNILPRWGIIHTFVDAGEPERQQVGITPGLVRISVGLEIEIDGARREKVPAVFEKIHVFYRLSGELDEKKVDCAISLALQKYCSAYEMLSKTAKTDYSFEIERTL